MHRTIAHCVPEDAKELALAHHTIFSRGPVYHTIYAGVDQAIVIKTYEKRVSNLITEQTSLDPDREVHFLKIVGDGSDEIMAYIIWIYMPHGYDHAKDPQESTADFPADSNMPVVEDFKQMLRVVRGDDEGRKGPHFLLALLGTHPKHERKGAATMLVKWIFERADKEQLPCYVDSSRTGHALYERLGFRDFGKACVDLDKFEGGNGAGLQTWYAMKREPQKEL
ncbi:uncharacterized protein KY384_000511 [Bacidia gigantensis]|uniref:uncharacterized protein n=1 Tax=Bacidia gigantensis TaxID=2732470 RepID=UPI001D05A91B|nr:uncharacterized protein KY384_000511 [Bacidia gigantensis]KAG8525751.1 hypothetical protein KY384_000511 [Bacidia gigantensis]